MILPAVMRVLSGLRGEGPLAISYALINVSQFNREFIRRFALHILPKGFTRIRHYGLLSSSKKATCKAQIDSQIGAVYVVQRVPSLQRKCPTCRKGVMVTVAVFDQRGPPEYWKEKLLK